jgi:hypothetical protein
MFGQVKWIPAYAGMTVPAYAGMKELAAAGMAKVRLTEEESA